MTKTTILFWIVIDTDWEEIDENRTFTSTGYIRNNGDSFHEEYDGANIPDEYKVFAMPKTTNISTKKD